MSPPTDSRGKMRFQAQAVLRRPDSRSPLRLAGVLVAGSFYPASTQDAWGPLHLDGGLVALAPLDPIETAEVGVAAALAMGQASRDWADGHSPDGMGTLEWRPMGDVRVEADARPIAELIELMTSANTQRVNATPSTVPYHEAARDLEDLASLVYDTARAEERRSEDDARDRANEQPPPLRSAHQPDA